MTEKIIFGTDKIAYIYSSAGVKVQKRVTEGGVVTLTDYLDGFQYVGGALSFLPTAEGFFTVETNAYVYQYRDHLGNVRLSYSDKNENNIIEANKIIEEMNYYPFGLAHKGYNEKNDALMQDYKYGYNGKESQEELGLNYYDYGARHYDAAIGRWMNVDPLAEKYPNINPYVYVANNSINAIDPDGKKIVYIIRGKGNIKNATFTYRNGNFYNNKNEIFTPDKNKHSSMYKVLNAYNKIEKSGDKELNKVLSTLVNSKTVHYVEQGNRDNKVIDSERKGLNELKESFRNGESVSSSTSYNFSEKSGKEFEESTGVSKSPFTTVVHEMSHQYDYDQGNMGDSVGKQSSATDPSEIRAVILENRARKIEGLPKRTKYGGEEIDFKN